jgi:hypothetical protein
MWLCVLGVFVVRLTRQRANVGNSHVALASPFSGDRAEFELLCISARSVAQKNSIRVSTGFVR